MQWAASFWGKVHSSLDRFVPTGPFLLGIAGVGVGLGTGLGVWLFKFMIEAVHAVRHRAHHTRLGASAGASLTVQEIVVERDAACANQPILLVMPIGANSTLHGSCQKEADSKPQSCVRLAEKIHMIYNRRLAA